MPQRTLELRSGRSAPALKQQQGTAVGQAPVIQSLRFHHRTRPATATATTMGTPSTAPTLTLVVIPLVSAQPACHQMLAVSLDMQLGSHPFVRGPPVELCCKLTPLQPQTLFAGLVPEELLKQLVTNRRVPCRTSAAARFLAMPQLPFFLAGTRRDHTSRLIRFHPLVPAAWTTTLPASIATPTR